MTSTTASILDSSPFALLPESSAVSRLFVGFGVREIKQQSLVVPSLERRPDRVISLVKKRIEESPFATSPVFTESGENFVQLMEWISPAISPTPQLAIDEDGTIESVWLVGGNQVTLSLGLDGTGFLLAVTDKDEYTIDEEFSMVKNPLDQSSITYASRFLATLGAQIVSPLSRR